LHADVLLFLLLLLHCVRYHPLTAAPYTPAVLQAAAALLIQVSTLMLVLLGH
jgi:hypothetical protein